MSAMDLVLGMNISNLKFVDNFLRIRKALVLKVKTKMRLKIFLKTLVKLLFFTFSIIKRGLENSLLT
jgi:hypothetical protein